MMANSISSSPRLVLRDGGFDIWEVEGKFHVIIPSMGTVVCDGEAQARNLMLHTQGHVVVDGKIRIEGGDSEALKRRNGGSPVEVVRRVGQASSNGEIKIKEETN